MCLADSTAVHPPRIQAIDQPAALEIKLGRVFD
jgi:hypothetical protein